MPPEKCIKLKLRLKWEEMVKNMSNVSRIDMREMMRETLPSDLIKPAHRMSWKPHVTVVAFRIHLSRDTISHLCAVISSQSLSVTLFLSRLVNISPRRYQLLLSAAI